MTKPITASTFVRNLSYATLRKISDFLDPQDAWKKVLVEICNSSGQPRYTQQHVRRFEALLATGRSPTIELLSDWGTTNCTVGELVQILVRNELLAPASLLLPDDIVKSVPPKCEETIDPSSQATVLLGHNEELEVTKSTTGPVEDEDHSYITGFHRFSFHDLLQMTGNFDERPITKGGSKLGAGGFGVVFKGRFNKTIVAVKKLNSTDDFSIDELKIQFDQEIQTLSMLKHDNLVEMIGFSYDGEHPCMVYAYMCNGSLLDRLACLDGSPPLPWQRRCLIVTGTARGLEYLHRNDHVHRDVKSANILLDETFTPKMSDFGLTRASSKRSSSTVMTEKIVGTTAYMAPEALRGEITPKSDVFSFGVVLLEALSGLPPIDEGREPQFLIEMKDEIEDEEVTLEEFMDKKMDWDLQSVQSMYSVAKSCLSEKKNRRPLMKEVLTQLDDVLTAVSLAQH